MELLRFKEYSEILEEVKYLVHKVRVLSVTKYNIFN